MRIPYTPHEYQLTAEQWAWVRLRCMLAKEMGLGKTVVTLTVLQRLLDACEATRILIIAPKRVADLVWPAEIQKWAHLTRLKFSLVTGDAQSRERAMKTKADVYIVSQSNLVWLLLGCLERGIWPFDTVVVDESHGYKDSSSKRWATLKRVSDHIERLILLTGTPRGNSYLDLWAQLYLIDAGERLGRTFDVFCQQYFHPPPPHSLDRRDWTLKKGADVLIQDKIRDVVLAMRAEDWLQLPPMVTVDVMVDLPAAARAQYLEMETDSVTLVEDAENGDQTAILAVNSGVTVNKLLQISNGLVYDEDKVAHPVHDAKFDALMELVDGLCGAHVVIVYLFKPEVARLKELLPGARDVRDRGAVDDWNAGRLPWLLLHPQSGGAGLNLQDGGYHFIWFGVPHSVIDYLQTIGRLNRQGQTHPVVSHRLLCKDTFDEDVAENLAGHQAGITGLMKALKQRKEART